MAGNPVENAEFSWLLKVDVPKSLAQLTQVINECYTRISRNSVAKYTMFYCSPNQLDVVKINTTLQGYRITSADINIKLASKHPMQSIRTCIKETPSDQLCWRLYQIQDAINHLGKAIDFLTLTSDSLIANNTPTQPEPPPQQQQYEFESAEQVLQLVNDTMNCLQKSRISLLIPKKKTIEELQHSQNMQSIRPALPMDYSISFYIQAHNLVCSVYQLSNTSDGPQIKAEFQSESSLAFLSEALVFLGLALQMCQQIKDKLHMFTDRRY